MSLTLLAPAGLWALAALVLPLLVHLARREEQQPTSFAALRWLAARLKPRQRLRFEEWRLLALRLLLVAGLALLLARPVLTGGAGDAPWLLVMPGADASQAPALPEDTERRWLAPGFPPLDATPPSPPIANASLLRQLDAELPAGTAITVLATAHFDGADGEPPRLSRPVDWRVVAGEAAEAKRPGEPAFGVAIRHDDPGAAGLRFLRAAAIAWQPDADAAPDIAGTGAALNADTHHLVWLAGGDLPAAIRAWVEDGGRVLLTKDAAWPLPDAGRPLWRDDRGEARAQAAPMGRGFVVQLALPLTPDALPALLEPGFPGDLRGLLQAPAPAPQRAPAEAYSPVRGGPGFAEIPRDLTPPLIWLLLALFAMERWLATGRREVAR